MEFILLRKDAIMNRLFGKSGADISAPDFFQKITPFASSTSYHA